jgi:hypothetical protein
LKLRKTLQLLAQLQVSHQVPRAPKVRSFFSNPKLHRIAGKTDDMANLALLTRTSSIGDKASDIGRIASVKNGIKRVKNNIDDTIKSVKQMFLERKLTKRD